MSDKILNRIVEQMDAMQGKMDAMQGKMDAMQGKMDGLQGQITDVQNEMKSMNNRLGKVENTMATQSDIERIEKGMATKSDIDRLEKAIDKVQMESITTDELIINMLKETNAKLDNRENDIQALNKRVFKVESELERLTKQ